VEYIALAEDDQMRQEFEEEAAQGTETELQGLVFLSPLRRAAAAAAAATTSAKARTGGREREGLRQVSLREDNNRVAISERTKRSGFGEFFEVFKKIGLTFQRMDNNRGANSERTKGWALENVKC
jgi:hypothetical protein